MLRRVSFPSCGLDRDREQRGRRFKISSPVPHKAPFLVNGYMQVSS
jgi:hypothetical protein